MVKEQVIRHYNFPANKIEVIYNGLNPDKLNPNPDLRGEKIQIRQKLGIASNALTLLFIGNDFARKGLEHLIMMFDALPATMDVALLVAGKDKHEKDYRQLAKRLGCGNRIHFLGYQNDVSQLFAAADLFILPSSFDAFGNVVLESLYCGIPVITGPAVGAGELIVNGANGFVVPDYAPATLAQAILKFNTFENKVKMSAEARRTAVDYCWDTHIQRMESILLDVMEQKWINR
jgi:UDP-glucose:(heptosyl)LPS alpha-1,3-glucosyltransferase